MTRPRWLPMAVLAAVLVGIAVGYALFVAIAGGA
jgi:hypothetical protein